MIYLTCFILYVCNVIMSVQSNIIRTTLGRVRGKVVDDETTGAYYYSFEGIPYAEPPVGNLRFKPPVPKRAWSNVFDATKPGRVCPQTNLIYSNDVMDEDCLTFNIFTPANYINKLLPVIFNIHGGDFNFLSGNTKPIYGPQLFIQSDMVVVSMNYRLGALGFLSLCTEEVSGNAGIKDVILVLKIVYENIEKFGGDPNKITIVGHGAGASMAQLLMLIKPTIGMFQKVILHSGTILSTEFLQLNPRKNAMLLGRELGLDLSSDDSMLKKMRHINVFDIIKAQDAIDLKDPQRGFRIFRPFKPTVEIESESAVITKLPLEMIRDGAIRDIPMLIGFNDQQGLEMFRLIRKEPELINNLNKNFELCVPPDIQYPYGSKERRNLATRIRNFYFSGGNITFVNVQNYINLISDSQYTFSIYYFIRLYKIKKNSPVYYYIFTGDTELNWFKAITNVTYPGAAHFDDIGYVYVTSVTKSRYKCLSSIAKRIQDNILLNIKYFIYYGAPTPNPNTNYWPETGKDQYHLLQDFNSYAVFHRPYPERIGFWDSVYEEYFNSSRNTGNYGCTNESVS